MKARTVLCSILLLVFVGVARAQQATQPAAAAITTAAAAPATTTTAAAVSSAETAAAANPEVAYPATIPVAADPAATASIATDGAVLPAATDPAASTTATAANATAVPAAGADATAVTAIPAADADATTANATAVAAIDADAAVATAAAPAAADSDAAATAVAAPGAAAAASAVAACQAYTKLDSAAAPVPASSPVLSTIVVPDTFPLGSVAVSDIQLAHGRVGGLKISLIASNASADLASAAAAPANASDSSAPPLASAVLKDVRAGSTGVSLQGTGFADSATVAFPADATSAPFTGAWKPLEALGPAFASLPSAAGSWSLRIVDLGEGRANRTIQLTKWTLVLCPKGAAAASTTADNATVAAAAVAPNVTAAAGSDPAAAAAAAATGATVTAAPGGTTIVVDTRSAAPASGTVNSGSGLGLLEQLLDRINRVNDTAATVPGAAAAAATPAAGAASPLEDEDATLVQQLLARLAELNATTSPPRTTGVAGRGGMLGSAATAMANATAGAAERAADAAAATRNLWRIGNTTVNDSDGLVSNFLSSLSDVLYALAGGNVTVVGAVASAAPLTPAGAALANVTSMAQSAFRSLLDGEPTGLSSMLQSGGGFMLDHRQRLIDVMPSGDNIRKALDGMAGGGALRQRVQSAAGLLAEAGGAVRNYRTITASSAGEFAAAIDEARDELVANQVAAYVRAVQAASDAATTRLREGGNRVVQALERTQALRQMITAQLAGMTMRDGAAAATALGPLLDQFSTGSEGVLRSVAIQMYDDAQNAVQLVANAYRARVDAASNVVRAGAAAVTNVAGAKYGMSLEALNGALDRLNAGLDAIVARGRPVASRVAKANKRGLDMLKASAGSLRTMLQSADPASASASAPAPAASAPAATPASAAASQPAASGSGAAGGRLLGDGVGAGQMLGGRLGGVGQALGGGQMLGGLLDGGAGAGTGSVRQMMVDRLQGLEDRIGNLGSLAA